MEINPFIAQMTLECFTLFSIYYSVRFFGMCLAIFPNKILSFVEAESGPWSAHLTGNPDTPSLAGSQVVTE